MAKTKRRRSSSASTEKTRSSNSLWFVGAGLLLIGLIIFFAMDRTREPTPSAASYTDIVTERSTLGNPDAIVTIETWEDFLCPACASWDKEIKPQLIKDYINTDDESMLGLVKLEFHHFPLIHANSIKAAEASECAADQGSFWPYHDRLFAETRTRSQQDRLLGFVHVAFVGYAKDLALDAAEFGQCLSQEKYRQAVDKSAQIASSKSLNSTPSILINGRLMADPFRYNTLKREIDRLLESEKGE